jgi:hypothetical protein
MSMTSIARSKSQWQLTIFILFSIQVIEVPLRIILNYQPNTFLLFFEMVALAFYVKDIYNHFYSPVYRHGKWIYNRKFIIKNYLTGWFAIDLLATIPFDLFITVLFPVNMELLMVINLVRLNRIIRIARIPYYYKKWEENLDINSNLIRLMIFLYAVSIFAHWVSCAWAVIINGSTVTFSEYIDALYWCITTLTTVGYGDITPRTMVQKIFTMLTMMIGVATYGYIIGNIASILSKIDLAKANHKEKTEKVNKFMRMNRFPVELQERVRTYYNYMWQSRGGYNNDDVFKHLPDSFKVEFSLQLNQAIIHKVPMFRTAGESLIKEIVLALKLCVFIPGERIVSYGEIGDRMYFISKGSVEVIAANGIDILTILNEGSFFGEIALLKKATRNASIKSIGYCELYSLDRDTFDKIIQRYPVFEKEIRKMAEERSMAAR